MAEKDIAEKTLEAYNDVFADIVNVLLFNGEQHVREDELEDETPLTQYKADGKLHEQERDVAKFWKNSTVRIALYGFENQTVIDGNIPLRVISYDGAAYRAQLLEKEKKPHYPVVTLVLYFGEKRWNRPRSLHECLDIPEELKPYVSDYKVNVFEIAWLTPEQVQLFRSDFKYVADYFVQMRMNHDYVPSPDVVPRVREVLTLLGILTGDDRFEEAANLKFYDGNGGKHMSEFLDRIISNGEKRGHEQGLAEGLAEGILRSVRSLMQTMHMTAEQAMTALQIPEEAKPTYRKLLES